MASSVRDDRRTKLKDILRIRQSSVVSELLAIQRHENPVEKAHEWAEDLLCLRYQPSLSLCFHQVRNHALNSKFVAVSWTRRRSAQEDPECGKYSMLPLSSNHPGVTATKRVTLDIRDSVLDRVVKYLKKRKIDIFWIDEACIAQDNPREKAEAINSMDLVYKGATKTVGLLSSPIRKSIGAQLMGNLFDGKLSAQDRLGGFHFHQGVCYGTISKVIRILQNLVGDGWWNRAWIYQEEYLSGLRMDLLIPVNSGVQVPSPYGWVPGEFCVQAATFREQTTIFLSAYSSTGWYYYRDTCRQMLETVGKYNIMLRQSGGALKPMSARVFADVGQRSVTKLWDTLAITANACGYRTRLDAEALDHEGRSLSLSLLAQFLLNGEIFTMGSGHHRTHRDLLQWDINTLLKELQPEFCDLPIETQQLTFLKYCRLPHVKFCANGLKTAGHIWSLPKHANINTRDFDLPFLSDARRYYLENHPWASMELKMLAQRLEQRHEAELAAKLHDYIRKARGDTTSPAGTHMDMMACYIFQAICRGLQLRLAYQPGQDASGIFVPLRQELSCSIHVLTTWQPPQQGIDQVGNAASLQVSLHGKRVVRPLRWINGIVFFRNDEVGDIVISWPPSWTEEPA